MSKYQFYTTIALKHFIMENVKHIQVKLTLWTHPMYPSPSFSYYQRIAKIISPIYLPIYSPTHLNSIF